MTHTACSYSIYIFLCYLLITPVYFLNQVQKLDAMFNAAIFAVNDCEKMQGCHGTQHTPCLQRKILDYFKDDGRRDIPNKMGQSRWDWIFIAFNSTNSEIVLRYCKINHAYLSACSYT